MPRRRPLTSVIFALLLTAGCSGPNRPGPAAVAERVPITRTVRIPVTTDPSGDSAKLAITPESADELAEGPEGFDVLNDGAFLITDPVRRRIAVFNADGTYRTEWPIGFRADSITLLPDGSAAIHDAAAGTLQRFSAAGAPTGSAPAPENPSARVISPNAGTVARAGGPVLEVSVATPGRRLLSLQSIGADSAGNTYVALETTEGGGEIAVAKAARVYSRDGRLQAETTDLPLDYYVRPVDELRVLRGSVYQLQPTQSEVRINIWELVRSR